MSLRVGQAALLCAVVGSVVYLNTLSCGLVYDDIGAIRRNMDLRPSTPWWNLWYNDYWGQPMQYELSHKSYRPLTVATFRLNYMLHELQPLGYHLVNVLLHSAVCYLYVLLCGVVFSEVWPALIAGLLFAVHPIHTEAVAGVVGRAELLCALFFLSAVLTYTRALQKGSVLWKLGTVLSVVCSLLSKEQGVTAVGVCVVYDIVSFNQGTWFFPAFTGSLPSTGRRQGLARLLRRVALMSIFGGAAVAGRLVLGHGSPGSQVFHRYVNPARYLETPYRQLSWLHLTFVNSWLLLNPFNLCADWRFGAVPLINSLIDPHNLLTLVTLGCVGGLAVWSFCGSGERHRAVALSLSLLVLPYLPASNLFFPVGFVVAERVLYLPSMGLCMLVALGAWQLLQKSQKISNHLQRCVKFFLAVLLISHSLKTVSRNRDWESGVAIYTAGVKFNPTSGVMLSNLGIEYAMSKDYDKSERLYRASMDLAPNYARAFFNFGKLMKIREKFNRAEWGFRHAIALGARDTGNGKQQGETYYHLVDTISANPQRLGEALEVCEKGIEFAESFGQLYITYSNLLVMGNRTQDALPVTKMAARKNPRSSVAHYNLGLVHMKLNQLPEAAVAFRTALSLQQDSVQVMYNLASVLQVTANGRWETLQEALELWMRLLSAAPHHTEALANLASLYYELRDIPNTRTTLLQILQQTPNHTDTHYRLGVLDFMQGNYQQAMETFSKVSLLQPGYKKTQAYLEMTEKELLQQRTL